MHTWIRDTPAHPTVPALQLITNGVPGPTVLPDGQIPGQTALFD